MAQLHEQLAAAVEAWRKQGYPCDAYPTISEILEWSHDAESGSLRYLRRPQLRALETCWYLRLVLNTPHVFDLYRHFCPRPRELREALAVRRWETLNPDRLRYEMIFTESDTIAGDRTQAVRRFAEESEP